MTILSSFLTNVMKGYREPYPTNCLLIEGSPLLPLNVEENDFVFIGIVDPILVIILRIIDPIITVVIHKIVNHILAIIQGIIDPIPEDTEGGYILHEGEVFR
ncbi:15180_t:CDS:2 [Funneliformis geosporum]|nr:15180_t:CDS:2 [Funneliformis geosporum]